MMTATIEDLSSHVLPYPLATTAVYAVIFPYRLLMRDVTDKGAMKLLMQTAAAAANSNSFVVQFSTAAAQHQSTMPTDVQDTL